MARKTDETSVQCSMSLLWDFQVFSMNYEKSIIFLFCCHTPILVHHHPCVRAWSKRMSGPAARERKVSFQARAEFVASSQLFGCLHLPQFAYSPVCNEAEEDVAEQAAHVEEGCTGRGPPVPITDEIMLKWSTQV